MTNLFKEIYDSIGCGGLIAVLLIAIALVLFGTPLVIMLCWNFAVVPWLGLGCTITFWQAFGVNFLLGVVGGKFYHYQSKSEEN